MGQNKQTRLGKEIVVSLTLLLLIGAAEVLCILFAGAGVILPASIGGLVLVAVLAAYTLNTLRSIKKNVIMPLSTLSHAANLCAMEETGQTPQEYDTNDEIGVLSKAFAALWEDNRRQNLAIQRIAAGELDMEGTGSGNSPDLDSAVNNIRALVDGINSVSAAIAAGKLEARLNTEGYPGAYGEAAQSINGALDAVTGPLTAGMSSLKKLSEGEVASRVENTYQGAFFEFVEHINTIGSNVHAIREETARLCEAAGEGRLECRADTAELAGGYAGILQNVNGMLDAVMLPLNESREIFGRLFLNDYTQKMSEHYQGYMKEYAEALNKIHYRFVNIQENFFKLTVGDTGRLEEFIEMKQKCENDRLLPAITKTLQTIRNLINETKRLAEAAINGDLSVRGDVDKFEGAYKDIINGMNKTMEAIIQPIVESGEVLKEVAAGNLTVQMTGNYKGEYNKIKESINHTVHSFNSILNDINTASSQVTIGARQVSESSVALSQGATEQASSVEQLTASIEQIALQTDHNTKDADQANKLAESAKENAEKGNSKMKEMLGAMEEINVSSGNISKIIKVIDDIAFQTNILALNAAVEAARAGQHGKGFTVVAEEVRNLAARSANAANETTELIKSSIEKVKEGTEIANETADALNEIVAGVVEAAHLVHNIAIASNEQLAAIAQVNQGIAQVSQVVKSNSATSEESAAASEELASQAEVLKEQIAKFRLRENGTDSFGYKDLNPDMISRFEKMFEKNHVLPESPPKPQEWAGEAIEMGKY
ncbi:MAG: methyl-accepting chemotaxis protein [Bacillota bacterium]